MSSTAAAAPRICICVVIGLSPMKGARKFASEAPESASLAGAFFAAAALAGRDEGPDARRVGIVDACVAAPGRAAGFCFAPVNRLNQSPKEDFGLIVCALAIGLFSPTRLLP